MSEQRHLSVSQTSRSSPSCIPQKPHAARSHTGNGIGVFHFEGVKGIETFWSIVTGDGGRIAGGGLDLSQVTTHVCQIQVLHLHLNEDWHDDYIDDILTDALTSFVAHSQNGSTLRKLCIHVQGNFLFTKHVYVLPQPAAAVDYHPDREWFAAPFFKTLPLHKFHSGRHSPTTSDKIEIARAGKLNPTARPKAFIRPLLELRGIAQVHIYGPMEASLQREIITTISKDQRVEFDDGKEEGLTAGERWHMHRIPREGWRRKDCSPPDRHESFRGHDHGEWLFPTDGVNKIILGWALEDVAY